MRSDEVEEENKDRYGSIGRLKRMKATLCFVPSLKTVIKGFNEVVADIIFKALYNITQDDNRIVNQIDKFNYDSMENIPDVIRPSWTKVSKDKAEFIKQVKLKQQVTAKQK